MSAQETTTQGNTRTFSNDLKQEITLGLNALFTSYRKIGSTNHNESKAGAQEFGERLVGFDIAILSKLSIDQYEELDQYMDDQCIELIIQSKVKSLMIKRLAKNDETLRSKVARIATDVLAG